MTRYAPFLLAAALLGAIPDAAAAASLRLLVPAVNTLVSGGGQAHVVVEIDAGVAPALVRAQLRGTDLGAGTANRRSNGAHVVHWTLRLTPGANAVDVTLGDPKQPAERHQRVVFYHEQVLNQKGPPPSPRAVRFHQTPSEAPCAECHTMTPAATDVGPASPERSTCFTCHAGLTRVKAVHGPAALWACTKCHDATSAPARYMTPQPVMPLCFGCHQEQKDRFYGNPYQHGPTATGYCTICHNPHGTENEYFVKKAVWNLCTTCHFEKGSGRHVVSWGPNGQTHPTRNKPDPSRVGKILSCASCHNPHAAPAPKLWNFGATRWMDLCRNCHPAIFGA